jgi:hypothetical protein
MEDRAMKKLLFSFMMVSLVATLWAGNRNRSELRISLFDGSAFSITVGNLNITNQSTYHIIGNLAPGKHFVEITKTERVRNRRGRWNVSNVIVFADYITLPRATAVIGEINRRGRFVVIEKLALFGNSGNNDHNNNWGSGINNGNSGNSGCNNGSSTNYAVMGHQAFAGLLNTLRNTSFDSNRLEIAKQALTWNWVAAMQVRQLMYLFSFESSKLEIAKFAFNSTIDPENYFIVHDAFTFSSSSRELNRHIAASY